MLLLGACSSVSEKNVPAASSAKVEVEEGGIVRTVPEENMPAVPPAEEIVQPVPGQASPGNELSADRNPNASQKDLFASIIPATVIRAIDGDTIEVKLINGKTETVRLIGMDTPEVVHPTRGEEPFGREASDFTRRTLAGKGVYLELDAAERDRYGRLLAYVWLSRPERGDEAEVRERMFNARLLLGGYGQLLTIPPNVRYAEMFRRFQAEAREAERGLWGLSANQAPDAQQPAAEPPAFQPSNCDPSYPDICIPPPPPDLDCRDVPHRRFRVLPPDPHRLDRDRDGVGCE